MHHNLKCVPKQFQPVYDKKMKAIVRWDDRGYQIGDTVTLQEGWPGINKDNFDYTGKEVSASISHIDDFGCQHGYVNISLADVGLLIVE